MRKNKFSARRHLGHTRSIWWISNRTQLVGTVRTENVLLLLPDYFTTPVFVCQYLFEIFLFFSNSSKFDFQYTNCLQSSEVRHDLRHFQIKTDKSTKNFIKIWNFFYCVSFLTNFSTKNRVKWIFTNSPFWSIILRLSAAPTPQRHAQR